MIRKHYLFDAIPDHAGVDRGPVVYHATSLSDVEGCALTATTYWHEELYMLFDWPVTSYPDNLGPDDAGCSVVLILCPGSEDDGYAPETVVHDVPYALRSTMQFNPQANPYRTMGVFSEEDCNKFAEMCAAVNEAAREEMERKHYELLKAKFEPEKIGVTVRPKIKAVYRGRKEAFK